MKNSKNLSLRCTKAKVKEFDVFDRDAMVWAKMVKTGTTDMIGWVLVNHSGKVFWEIEEPSLHDDPKDPF